MTEVEGEREASMGSVEKESAVIGWYRQNISLTSDTTSEVSALASNSKSS